MVSGRCVTRMRVIEMEKGRVVFDGPPDGYFARHGLRAPTQLPVPP